MLCTLYSISPFAICFNYKELFLFSRNLILITVDYIINKTLKNGFKVLRSI